MGTALRRSSLVAMYCSDQSLYPALTSPGVAPFSIACYDVVSKRSTDMAERRRRITVRGIIFKDGKLLVVRHFTPERTPRPNYATPGGGLDPEEALVDGVQRELIEETGIAPKVGKLLFIQQFIGSYHNTDSMDLFFHIENPEDYEHIDLSATSHGIQELHSIEFVDPQKSFIKPVFLSHIDIAAHISENKPVVIFDNLTIET